MGKKILLSLVLVMVAALTYQLVFQPKINMDLSEIVRNNDIGAVSAPGFEKGGDWFNSEGLVLEKLMEENKVVLVDFWTYSCINCQRTFPYLMDWWDKYQDKGLVIVGVHAPEFEFEKEDENLKMAMEKYEIDWPVVQDNEMQIWKEYNNRYWPAKYLVVPPGKIVYKHFGEGAYLETEKRIRSELERLGYDVSEVELGNESDKDRVYDQSPETYLGWQRGRFGNKSQVNYDQKKSYQLTGEVKRDAAYLVGVWTIEEELARAGEEAELRYRFKAGEVNLVMRAESESVVEVWLGGEKYKEIAVEEADLYSLYKGEVRETEMRLVFDEGVEAFAFTFGGSDDN